MAHRHYAVLGVPRDELARGISSAFRDLDRHLHPERGSAYGTAHYRETLTAFAVLGDPHQRESYDRKETLAAQRDPQHAGPDERLALRFGLHSDFQAAVPSREELFARIRQNYLDVGLAKSAQLEPIDLAVALPPEVQGDPLQIGVPTFRPCRACHGEGSIMAHACRECDAGGLEEVETWVDVDLDGDGRGEVSLVGLGIRNLWLRVRLTS